MSRVARSLAVLATVLIPIGCASPAKAPLPRHEWVDVEHAIATLVDRANAITTLDGTGDLILHRGQTERVRLDAIMLCQPPDRVRVRTFKMNNTVFDVLLCDDELWVYAPHADCSTTSLRDSSTPAARLVEGLALLLRGGVFEDATYLNRDGDRLVLSCRPQTDGAYIRVVVRLSTLTPLSYTYISSNGDELYRIDLSEYAIFERHVLPTRILGVGPSERFDLRLEEFTVNAPLPETAFAPATGSVRIQPSPGES